MKPIYAVGLDAGSRRTRLVICILEEGRMRFLGCGLAESHGWQKGKIADQTAVAESMIAALREAEAAAGISVESAVVGMGGPTVRGATGRGVIELGVVRAVEQRDVNKVVDRASRVQLQEDRMVLQMFPQDFVVDDHPGHRDPRNMLASRLEMNVHLITASIQEHNSLVGAVNQAHLLVEETVFEAMAACYAAVLPEDRREGIALVDIGAHSTDLVAYYGDSMHLASTLPICADHFSRDLVKALCLTFEEAEIVKREFGSTMSSRCAENVLIELPTPENRERRHAARQFVSGVLEARAMELFQFVRNELARVGMDRALAGGIFLTGGGAKLPDLCDVAEHALHCQARFGLTFGIRDWPADMDDPEWTTAAGLAMYSATMKAQMADQKAAASWLSRILE